jgi:hypothetical protein
MVGGCDLPQRKGRKDRENWANSIFATTPPKIIRILNSAHEKY